jgi:hypothetical protein
MRRTKRIQLPSGKVIEVVYFEPENPCSEMVTEADYKALDRIKADGINLHICPQCKSDMVYPVHWEEYDDKHWQMTLRCPECEYRGNIVAPQSDADLFDEHLSDTEDALTRDYKRLMAANFAEEIDRWVKAFDADAILPEDFDF